MTDQAEVAEAFWRSLSDGEQAKLLNDPGMEPGSDLLRRMIDAGMFVTCARWEGIDQQGYTFYFAGPFREILSRARGDS